MSTIICVSCMAISYIACQPDHIHFLATAPLMTKMMPPHEYYYDDPVFLRG